MGQDGNRKRELIIIDELKLIEFELILEQFPQVKAAVEDYCKVDFVALAQHYELNTNLIDVTSDIATAAFFATHYYDHDDREYYVKSDGIGCLRVYSNMWIDMRQNTPFRMIGLQPFQRPGLQSAFGVKMSIGENFADISHKILFKQSSKWNQKINDFFYSNGKNMLFPTEEIVAVANKVKESSVLSKLSIEKYCADNMITYEEIVQLLTKNGYTVTENVNARLSRQQRRKIERNFDGNPYGDAIIRFRSVYVR